MSMCEPQSIVDGLEAIDNNDDKVDYVVNILDSCGVITKTSGAGKKKAKRPMTGYNCFTKNLYAAEKEIAKDEKRKPMSFKEMISMKTWSTLEDKKKRTWDDIAKQGCPSTQM